MDGGRIPALFATALAPALWGTTYWVTRELLPPGRPLFAAAVRSLPVGLALVAISRSLPRGPWWWRAATLGALNIGLFFALLFTAAYRLPGGVAATVGGLQPLVVVALSWPLLGERPRLLRAGAALLGAGGVWLLVGRAPGALDPLGVWTAILGSLSMATGVVLAKRWTLPVPLLAFTDWQLAAGGLLLLPLALVVEGLPDALGPEATAGYAYLALAGGGLAYALWFRGIGRLHPAAVSLLGLLSPVVALLVGWAALGETLAAAQMLGVLLVFAAVALGQYVAPAKVVLLTPEDPADPG
jgi:probable blue pigment (indigoidine) exporter